MPPRAHSSLQGVTGSATKIIEQDSNISYQLKIIWNAIQKEGVKNNKCFLSATWMIWNKVKGTIWKFFLCFGLGIFQNAVWNINNSWQAPMELMWGLLSCWQCFNFVFKSSFCSPLLWLDLPLKWLHSLETCNCCLHSREENVQEKYSLSVPLKGRTIIRLVKIWLLALLEQ